MNLDDHKIHCEHLKSKWIRDYGCPAALISYHLRDVIETKEKYTNLKDIVRQMAAKKSKIKRRYHMLIRNILDCVTRQDSWSLRPCYHQKSDALPRLHSEHKNIIFNEDTLKKKIRAKWLKKACIITISFIYQLQTENKF